MRALADLLLPSVCPLCQANGARTLCDTCRAQLPRLPHPCLRCGRPRRLDDDACPDCHGRGLDRLAAVTVRWSYEGVLERCVSRAKVAGNPAAVHALTTLLPSVSLPANAVVVPVPPAPGRQHGPHLATALARQAARRAGVRLRHALRCTRLAAPQHRLAQVDRRRNVVGLFACRRALDAPVLLVDDLLTSGATASAAAAALRTAGAPRVTALFLARTPRGEEPPALSGEDDAERPDPDAVSATSPHD